jgi:VanZ family protein
MTSTATRPMRLAFLAAITLVILVLTLTPVPGPQPDSPFALEITALRGAADAAANILLFIPFGVAAALVLRGSRPVFLAAVGLTLFVEVAQLLIPGRFTSPGDVAFNTLGATLGLALVRRPDLWVTPPPLLRGSYIVASLQAAVAVAGAGTALFAPAVPPFPLYGQWTAVFGNMETYDGTVLEARVGDLPVPSRRVPESDRLRRYLERDSTMAVRFTAGPPPAGLAPIFSIFDSRAVLVHLVGADGDDLVLRYRMRATAWRLDQPDLRIPGALAGIAPGSEVRLTVRAAGRERCVAINDAVRCGVGLGPGDTWGFLLYPLPRPLAAAMPFLWLAALLLPAGFWLQRPALIALAAPAAAAAIAAAAAWAGALPPSLPELAAGAAGMLAGAGLQFTLRNAAAAPPALPGGRPTPPAT